MPHVGASGQHAAVEICLDPDNAQHGISLAKGILSHLADALSHLIDVAGRIDVLRDGDAEWQPILVVQLPILFNRRHTGIAVNNRCQTHRVVILKKSEQSLHSIQVGGLPAGRLAPDVASAVSQDARGLSGFGIFLGVTGPQIGHLEIFVDLAELQGQAIERGVRSGAKDDRILGRGPVQFVLGGIALLAQPSDEDLIDSDPLAYRHHFGSRLYII